MLGIELNQVCKFYAERAVLREINFNLLPGKIVKIVGANGAGKSTLLQIIAGVTTLDRGSVGFVSSNRNCELSEIRHEIGLLLKFNFLYNELSVEQNIRLYAPTSHDNSGYLASLFKELKLETFKHSLVAELSMGELQRVAILRALIRKPKLLLLDEPFSHLDVDGQQQLLLILNQLKQQGVTALIITHAMPEADTLIDDELVLENGRIKCS